MLAEAVDGLRSNVSEASGHAADLVRVTEFSDEDDWIEFVLPGGEIITFYSASLWDKPRPGAVTSRIRSDRAADITDIDVFLLALSSLYPSD